MIETEQFGAQFDVDAAIGRSVRAQRRLDRRLREHHGGGVTKRIRLGNHIDPADQLALGAKMLRGGKWCDIGFYAFGGAEIIQQAKDLVVDRDRARLVVDVALAVDRKRADISVAEQARRDDAGGAVTDDDHRKSLRAVHERHSGFRRDFQ